MHAPLPEAERIRSLDVLRGVAVLGAERPAQSCDAVHGAAA